jgi:hypothetical protein
MGNLEKSRRILDPGGEQRLIPSLRASIMLLPIGHSISMTLQGREDPFEGTCSRRGGSSRPKGPVRPIPASRSHGRQTLRLRQGRIVAPHRAAVIRCPVTTSDTSEISQDAGDGQDTENGACVSPT